MNWFERLSSNFKIGAYIKGIRLSIFIEKPLHLDFDQEGRGEAGNVLSSVGALLD